MPSLAPAARPPAPRRLEAPLAPALCVHCASPTGGRADGFCCDGCLHVHELLNGQGLARYYALRGDQGVPVLEKPRSAGDDAWIDIELPPGTPAEQSRVLSLDVEGIHCSGCVWLIEEIFRRSGAPGHATVNPALGTLELAVQGDFSLREFSERLRELGYRLGPRRKETQNKSDELIWRIGVCTAIAMNAMIFAISRYAGLGEGWLSTLFIWLELGLAIASFFVGGIVFVRAAVMGLRRGLVHLDLPIAVGLVLGHTGSILLLAVGQAHAVFFDTLIIFTTLMLVGRFLRERVLEKNRAQLLDDGGIEGLLARRVRDGHVEVVPVTDIVEGDELLVASGDVVPVQSTTEDDRASFSLDWITGESEPRTYRNGEVVPAGAANAGTACRVRAGQSFSQSRLIDLLRTPRAATGYGEAPSQFERRIASIWVPAVLVAAAAGFALHVALGAGWVRALGISVAVLVVTCPCSFGIAAPIANELVLGGLRKRGLLVRTSAFLERATSVKRVLFDKTGTLTTGQLALASTAPFDALDEADRAALYNLVCRSSHPKSAAIKQHLEGRERFLSDFSVEETPGVGVRATHRGHDYRLGAPQSESEHDVELSRDGVVIAAFDTREELRPDAASEVRGLTADGLEIWMLTGDKRDRAERAARACGIADSRVVAERSPEQKASFVEAHDHGDTLMIGDGVNDAPAVRVAHCSGTPAAGRAFLASRADFYLLTAGLGPVRQGLSAARALRAALRRNLIWATSYNGIALALSYAGLMSPLLCAVLMPCSSLVSIGLVTRALGPKGSVWRS